MCWDLPETPQEGRMARKRQESGLPSHCTAWVLLAFFTFYHVNTEINKIQIREKTKCQKTRVNPIPLLTPPLLVSDHQQQGWERGPWALASAWFLSEEREMQGRGTSLRKELLPRIGAWGDLLG